MKDLIIFALTIFVTMPIVGDTAISVKNFIVLRKELRQVVKRMKKVRTLLCEEDTTFEAGESLRYERAILQERRSIIEKDRDDEVVNIAIGIGLTIAWAVMFILIVIMLYK